MKGVSRKGGDGNRTKQPLPACLSPFAGILPHPLYFVSGVSLRSRRKNEDGVAEARIYDGMLEINPLIRLELKK